MKLWNTALLRTTVLATIGTAAILIGCSDSSSSSKTPVSTIANGKIHHVWVITLENENYSTTFGATTKAPYLAQTLTAQGALLQQYYGTGHVSLDNYIAMMSGQAGTPQTIADCQTYADYNLTGTTTDGQAEGSGCVYPATIKTLPDELAAANFTWKGYMGDMGNDPSVEAATSTTPNFSFITPSLCDDGHDAPCVTGEPGGLTSADAFLQKWIPLITASPAYKADGLIIINFDESGAASEAVSGSTITVTETGTTCCNQQPGPNLGAYPMTESIAAGSATYNLVYQNYGGDQTGAVLLSPFIKAGTVSTTPYNHYSMLKTLQDIFILQPYLGYAGQSGLQSMGTDIFTNAQ